MSFLSQFISIFSPKLFPYLFPCIVFQFQNFLFLYICVPNHSLHVNFPVRKLCSPVTCNQSNRFSISETFTFNEFINFRIASFVISIFHSKLLFSRHYRSISEHFSGTIYFWTIGHLFINFTTKPIELETLSKWILTRINLLNLRLGRIATSTCHIWRNIFNVLNEILE